MMTRGGGVNIQLRCFAHTLQLAVRDAIKEAGLSSLLKMVRRLVARFRKSNVLMDALWRQQRLAQELSAPAAPEKSPSIDLMVMEPEEASFDVEEVELVEEGVVLRAPDAVLEAHVDNAAQAALHLLRIPSVGRKLKLLIDTPTRWNSTFYMIERLLVMRPFVEAAIAINSDALVEHAQDEDAPDEDRGPVAPLLKADWQALEDVWRVLFHVAELTARAQGEKYPSLGQALFDLTFLRKSILGKVEDAHLRTEIGRTVRSYRLH